MAPLGPFCPLPALAVGVSGGPHSLALALLARNWAAGQGGSVLGLVVDHGLRAESAAEAAWTAATLRQHDIPAEILTLALPGGAALQERAREGRLAAMLRRCGERGLPWLLLGQHRMDQAETLLFRALRGSGPAGLAGMAGLRAAAEAAILRPLLPLPPARLEATLAHAGIDPLRDPSNADPRFTRARLRLALADPGGTGPAVAALEAAATAFARRRATRAAAVAQRLAAAVSLRPEGWARVDAAGLGQDALAQAAMAGLLRLFSGAPHAPAAVAVAALLARGQGTLHGVVWSGGVLCREGAACAPPVAALPATVWDGRWRLASAPPGLLLGALGPAASGLNRAALHGLPARVLFGLPALWDGEKLLAVPALGLGPPVRLDFAPAGGPFPDH
jgi:tRNA(Ile)-lysidine synthase